MYHVYVLFHMHHEACTWHRVLPRMFLPTNSATTFSVSVWIFQAPTVPYRMKIGSTVGLEECILRHMVPTCSPTVPDVPEIESYIPMGSGFETEVGGVLE